MRYKYPRTLHLPWSEGITSDDKVLTTLEAFEGQRVVITEKMDGENTTLYNDGIHARSIDGLSHPSRDWVKSFWASIKHNIPAGYRICGENLYAKHSLGYTDLPSYFMGFSMWKDDVCLSWSETMVWFALLEITPVPLLYAGVFDLNSMPVINPEIQEGYVLRLSSSFTDFQTSVAKYVRANHVQTEEHWMTQAVEPNKLK